MKKIFMILGLILVVTACTSKSMGWSQNERDELVNKCVEAATKNPSLDKTKVTNYCTCYQKDLEKNYPNINDLAKLSADDMTKSAQACLPLMLK